jgi:hypothetical protein
MEEALRTICLAKSEQKDVSKMSAYEYTASLTASDAELKKGREFYFRDTVRKACRFHPRDPHQHVYMDFDRWSKQVSLIYVKGDIDIKDDPTAKRFASAAEFEALVSRLQPKLMTKCASEYKVNFSREDMKRACERYTFPYRPKDLPEYTWEQEEVYYLADPDNEASKRTAYYPDRTLSEKVSDERPRSYEKVCSKCDSEFTTVEDTTRCGLCRTFGGVSMTTEDYYDFMADRSRQFANSKTT